MRRLIALAFALMLAGVPSMARGGGHSGKSAGTHRPARASSGAKVHSPRTKCVGCTRTSNGEIKRSGAAKREFQRSHPCPATGKATGPCKGYVVDHVVPLKRGGADSPSNMQWQTKEAAKAKDKIE